MYFRGINRGRPRKGGSSTDNRPEQRVGRRHNSHELMKEGTMYHYTESGLGNVWLKNGYVMKNTPYGEGVSIQDVEGLHKLIGTIIAKRPKLTGKELRFLRKEMEMSQRALGELLGTSEQNIS